MYNNVLIPVALDHEENLPEAVAVAKRLMADGGAITLLTVLEQVPGYIVEFLADHSDSQLRLKVLEKLQDAAKGHSGVECEVIVGKAGMAISKYAADHGVDLIIVGSHRPGLQDYFLGSTASRVVRRAPCAVLVQR